MKDLYIIYTYKDIKALNPYRCAILIEFRRIFNEETRNVFLADRL